MRRSGFMSEYETMQEHLVEAGCALLGEMGATVTEVRDGAPLEATSEIVVASLGYLSAACRGAVVLVSTPAMLRAYQTGGPRPETDAALGDLQGELANMLLGRLKTSLLRHGVMFAVSTPTSIVGRDVSLPPPKGGTSSWHHFTSERGSVFVRFDVIFEPAFVLPAEGAARREGDAVEGDVLVF